MKLTWITALIGLTAATVCAQLPQGDIKSGDGWMPLDCKTLDHWPGYTVNPANLELSKYGGWLNGPRQTATGFFRVQKVNGRWWCVDPEGYLYIHKALNSVNMDFDTADVLYTKMREYGFNGFGNWTWNGPTGGGPADRSVIGESTVKDQIPMAYTPRFGMIGSYRNQRLPAGTPRIELPVFDPGFEQMAPVYAQNAITNALKNDPHLFGYFTDNELPFRYVLSDHLAITDTADPNYVTAVNFLVGRGKLPSNWDQADADAYTALAGERYYSVVSQAIRAVDPNHMYLGSRQHSAEKGNEAFMRNAGKYVDIMAVNHYHHWGDRRIATNNMAQWLGRPLMFTEFYVKSLEDGDSAENGAGFNGRNLTSGALFYQNFVTTHLESGNLVGFHWFKYGAIIGEAGALKESGSFNNVLFDSMKKMNTQMYNFIDYVDTRPAPDAVLNPEADAYFEGGTNRGSEPELKVKYASSPGISTFRQTYMRFDVSPLGNRIESAKIVLRTVQSGGTGVFQVELVEDDSWDETTIRNSNAPAGSTVLRTFSDGRSDLEIDVTSVIRQELAGDGKLSIRIIGTGDYNTVPVYGSSRHPDPVARPVLNVEYATYPPFTAYWDGLNGSWGDVVNWSTDAGSTQPDPAAVPGAFDDVIFNITTANSANQSIYLDADQAAKSLTFNSPGNTAILRSPAPSTSLANFLTLGGGGLTVGPVAGMVDISSNVDSGALDSLVNLRLAGSSCITHNGNNFLHIGRRITTADNLGDITLTLNGSGSGITELGNGNSGTSVNNQGTGTNLTINVNNTGDGILYLRTSGSTIAGFTLTRGTVGARGSNILGSNTPMTFSGGTFGSLASGDRSYNGSVTINGDFQLGLGSRSVDGQGSSRSTFSNTVNLNGATRSITLGNDATFAGNVTNGGLNLLAATGRTAILNLSGATDYSGLTTVGANITLRLNSNLALQNSALDTDGGGAVSLGTNTGADPILTINTPTIGGLTGSTDLAGVITTNYNLVTRLTLNPHSDIVSYGGNIPNGADDMTLTKTGNGTQVLSGTNTYTGPTHVIAGGLIIHGDSMAATGTISVASGARLGGTGTSGGAVIFAPGAVLSTRITDWTGTAGSGYDHLAVASFDAGGGVLCIVIDTTGLTNFTEANQSFTILSASGGITGFDPLQVSISAPGFPGTAKWALVQEGNSLVLQYTADSYLRWIDGSEVADKSKDGDPDHDDMSNLMEFVLNGKPGISDPDILPKVDLSTTNFTFSYVRRADSTGVPQMVQYGSDLSGWTDVVIPAATGTTTAGAATVIVGEPAGGTQTVTASIPPSDPGVGKMFGRLKVGL